MSNYTPLNEYYQTIAFYRQYHTPPAVVAVPHHILPLLSKYYREVVRAMTRLSVLFFLWTASQIYLIMCQLPAPANIAASLQKCYPKALQLSQ